MSSGERPLRLFVALELPAAAVAALAAFRDEVAGDVWRGVADAALHVTLAFLGPRPASAVATCAAVVEEAGSACRDVRLALGDPVLLPPRRPRVLAVELSDLERALGALQARVSDSLAAGGLYTPETRPFRAHVTVARLRPRAAPPRRVDGRPEHVAFSAPAVAVFVSRLHPSGARYEALARVPLPGH